ncbi:MAG: hypothetical protein HY471_00555 [Candidatus Sungbacteria bacterium]|nr:hypothetical protein [Candidatus Sungbacteria bacterium]
MKTLLLAAVLAAGIYIGFTRLPEDMKSKTSSYLGAVNLSRFYPESLLPPLKAKVEPLREAITPENPAKNREKIIQALAGNLETIAEHPAPTTPDEKEAVREALNESKKLIEELKTENQKSGIVSNTIERLANAVLPASYTSTPPANSTGKAVCP